MDFPAKEKRGAAVPDAQGDFRRVCPRRALETAGTPERQADAEDRKFARSNPGGLV